MESKRSKEGSTEFASKAYDTFKWVSVGAPLVAVLALVISVLTLNELKLQRRQMDKPRMLISSMYETISVYWSKIEVPFLSVLPLTIIPGTSDGGETAIHERGTAEFLEAYMKLEEGLGLELINAGLGPAIEIRIHWEIEGTIGKLIEQIDQSNLGIKIEYEESSGLMEIMNEDGSSPVLIYSETSLRRIPYALSYSSVEDKRIVIPVPSSLMLVLCLTLAVNVRAAYYQPVNLPQLYCSISFKDRAGNEYQDDFVIDLKPMLVRRGLSESALPETLLAILEPQILLESDS